MIVSKVAYSIEVLHIEIKAMEDHIEYSYDGEWTQEGYDIREVLKEKIADCQLAISFLESVEI